MENKNKDVVAIYCRLSKEDADKINKGDDSESIQNQKMLLMDYAIQETWSIYEVYSDDDRKGFDRDRPAFNKLLTDADKGHFNIVLCKHQSRFTRDMEIVERYIHSEFANKGIRFVSIIDHVDTAIKGTKKARQVNSLVNEWYSEDLSENIRAVFKKKMEDGQSLCSFTPYGYLKDPKDGHYWIVDEAASAVVKEIYTRYIAGEGADIIAKSLSARCVPTPSQHKINLGLNFRNPNMDMFSTSFGAWARNTVSAILKNESYIGTLIQGRFQKVSYKSKKVVELPRDMWIITKHHHEPLVDVKTFTTVNNLVTRRRNSRNIKTGVEPTPPNMLAGKLLCGDCGGTLHRSGTTRDRKTHYVRCQLASKTKNRECTPHVVSQEKIEDILLANIQELISGAITANGDSSIVSEILDRVTATKDQKKSKQKLLSTVELDLKKVERNLASLYADKYSGSVTAEEYPRLKAVFEEDRIVLLKRKAAYEKELEEYEKKIASHENVMAMLSKYKKIETLNHEIINDFIDSVVVYEKDAETNKMNIEINWLF